MAWIESHTALEKHPKLLLFKSRMRWSKNESIGFLHRFWWTVLDYAPNGVVTTLSAELLAEQLEIEPSQAARALEVMEQVGFLKRRGSELVVNDWIEFAGTYLRSSKFRRSPKKWIDACAIHEVSHDCHATDARQSRTPTYPPTNLPTAGGMISDLAGGSEAKTESRLIQRFAKRSANESTRSSRTNGAA